jgi:hypothetical protein
VKWIGHDSGDRAGIYTAARTDATVPAGAAVLRRPRARVFPPRAAFGIARAIDFRVCRIGTAHVEAAPAFFYCVLGEGLGRIRYYFQARKS